MVLLCAFMSFPSFPSPFHTFLSDRQRSRLRKMPWKRPRRPNRSRSAVGLLVRSPFSNCTCQESELKQLKNTEDRGVLIVRVFNFRNTKVHKNSLFDIFAKTHTSDRMIFTRLCVGWPATPQVFLVHQKCYFFFNVFTMFYCKHALIYTFWGVKSVQNTGFYSVFSALTSENP